MCPFSITIFEKTTDKSKRWSYWWALKELIHPKTITWSNLFVLVFLLNVPLCDLLNLICIDETQRETSSPKSLIIKECCVFKHKIYILYNENNSSEKHTIQNNTLNVVLCLIFLFSFLKEPLYDRKTFKVMIQHLYTYVHSKWTVCYLIYETMSSYSP